VCAGTEICNDPVHQMTTILLTNRCYPVKTGNLGVNIEHARQHFNNAALQVFTAASFHRHVKHRRNNNRVC